MLPLTRKHPGSTHAPTPPGNPVSKEPVSTGGSSADRRVCKLSAAGLLGAFGGVVRTNPTTLLGEGRVCSSHEASFAMEILVKKLSRT